MTAPTDDADLPVHRVPVTVFTTVRGVDYRDAAHVAEYAVRHALAGAPLTRLPVEIRFKTNAHDVPVQVEDVMETGMAAGNGYLWVEATSKAYRERG